MHFNWISKGFLRPPFIMIELQVRRNAKVAFFISSLCDFILLSIGIVIRISKAIFFLWPFVFVVVLAVFVFLTLREPLISSSRRETLSQTARRSFERPLRALLRLASRVIFLLRLASESFAKATTFQKDIIVGRFSSETKMNILLGPKASLGNVKRLKFVKS